MELERALEWLNLSPGDGPFGEKQIRSVYRKAAREFHPDTGGSHQEFLLVTDAFETLMGQYGHQAERPRTYEGSDEETERPKPFQRRRTTDDAGQPTSSAGQRWYNVKQYRWEVRYGPKDWHEINEFAAYQVEKAFQAYQFGVPDAESFIYTWGGGKGRNAKVMTTRLTFGQ